MIRFSNFSFSTYVRYLYICMLFCSLTFILFYYNDDGKLHDAGVYYNSGLDILRGENPYPDARWGSFGAIPFSILISVFPEEIKALVVRILSLAGIYIFFRFLYPNKRLIEPLAISFVLLWTSPVRELMVTNQMTGIVIGLLALGVKFLEPFTSFRKISKATLAGALFFAMALDLKPHICIIFFLSWAIFKKSIPKFLIVILTLLITHLIIDLSQMKILEIEWFNTLSRVNESASQASLGDSLSFWPILNHLLDENSILYFASILVTCILAGLCLYWAYRGRWDDVMFLSFFIPSTSIYYHYYDAVPLCVLFMVILFRINNLFLISFTASFILIPKEYMSIRNQILVLLIIGIFALRLILKNKNGKHGPIIISAISGLFTSTLLHLINTKLELSEHLLQSLIVTESLVMISSLYIYTRARKISLA
jgi:hypothetical protein